MTKALEIAQKALRDEERPARDAAAARKQAEEEAERRRKRREELSAALKFNKSKIKEWFPEDVVWKFLGRELADDGHHWDIWQSPIDDHDFYMVRLALNPNTGEVRFATVQGYNRDKHYKEWNLAGTISSAADVAREWSAYQDRIRIPPNVD